VSQLKQYSNYKIQTFLMGYHNIEGVLQFLVEEQVVTHLLGLINRVLELITRFLANNFLRHFEVNNHEELIFELTRAQIY
jgi:hypothetical protein